MKGYFISLSDVKVFVILFGTLVLGILLLRIQNIKIIVFGLLFSIISIHELGHYSALKYHGYNATGIWIYFFTPSLGIHPDRNVTRDDSTVVYLSGLVTLIIPLVVMFYTFLYGMILMICTISMSLNDVLNWLELKGYR